MMNQTNNKEFQGKRIDWQQTLDTSKEIAQGLYKILKGLGRYAWGSLKRNASNRLKVFIIALIVSLIYIIPLLMSNGILYGDDLHFHLNRVLSLATIKESPVNFKAFYKVGQGVDLFYPYLTYYPYYLFYKLTNSLYTGWIIYVYCLSLVTYLISYYSSKGIVANNFSSHIFSIFYVFSAYRLGNIVIRFATGEVIAMTFLPLVFYGLYQIIKGNYRKWYILTFGVTLLIYSHILTAVMTAVLVGLIFLTSIWFQEQKLLRFYNFLISVSSSLALGAMQIFSILEQFSYSKIDTPGGFSLNDSSRTFAEIFQLSLKNEIKALVPGLLILVAFILILLQVRKLKKEDFYIIVWVIALLLFESKLIVWPSNASKILDVIQFPWRVNSFITLFSTFLASKIFITRRLKSLFKGLIFFGVLISLTAVNIKSSTDIFKTLSHHKPVVVSELSYRNKLNKVLNVIALRDYANLSAREKDNIPDTGKKIAHQVIIKDSEILLESNFTFKNSYAQGTILNDTGQEQIVELPFYRYKGQIVTLDGKEVPTILSDSGATTIHFPAGQHKVKITYEYTAMAKVAHAASIMALLMIILYMLIYNLLEKYKIDLYFDRKRGLMIYPA
ncbi:hypothetical protein QM365_02620 [Streptococcus sobrinus]|uniref:Membrane protein 6-pyruvoyl-tetrahydropterin synthase-related domain-containing protein n=2 Tax=Streptococcus sobrinus TaxID=1310 RepID=U2IKA4_9STRE|nr:hypothetical protein [Streptococcus sobrinus]ERJ74331.1 hypothetical protein HMPREF1557_01732 [Streptococcus sobrinus W1703]